MTHDYLHTEQGSEIGSQVVTGETFWTHVNTSCENVLCELFMKAVQSLD